MIAGSSRLERMMWASALLAVAATAGFVAWKRDARVRAAVDRALQRVADLETCEPVGTPPESGPVRLPTCRTRNNSQDPWLAPGAHGPDLSVQDTLSEGLEQHRWTWEDVNTVPIVRWDGDTRVVKPGALGRRLNVRGGIDLSRAQAQERAFGYQIPNAVIRYRDDAELATKRASLDAVLAKHGVQRRRSQDGDVLAPDYEWMIEASLDDVRPLARAILAEARKRGAHGLREEFGAFASFVQHLTYGDAPEPDDGKHRFGLSMPLWTLATGIGDCDTRAVLLASLTRSIHLCEVHLVRDADHQHMLAAADIPVRADDRYVQAAGKTLVLVETTDDWPIGHVAGRTDGERLQTLYLADSAALSARARAPQAPSGPQPISMRAPRPEPERGTSARSTLQRSRQ
jgi:hypothetical protein